MLNDGSGTFGEKTDNNHLSLIILSYFLSILFFIIFQDSLMAFYVTYLCLFQSVHYTQGTRLCCNLDVDRSRVHQKYQRGHHTQSPSLDS